MLRGKAPILASACLVLSAQPAPRSPSVTLPITPILPFSLSFSLSSKKKMEQSLSFSELLGPVTLVSKPCAPGMGQSPGPPTGSSTLSSPSRRQNTQLSLVVAAKTEGPWERLSRKRFEGQSSRVPWDTWLSPGALRTWQLASCRAQSPSQLNCPCLEHRCLRVAQEGA